MENEKDSLLHDAAVEIRRLRTQLALAQAKLQMFDDIKLLLHAELPRTGGLTEKPDVCYQIDRVLRQKSEAKPQPPIDGL